MDLVTQNKTMSLKEITDLLDVRHNDAMRTVSKMAESPEFGNIRKIRKSPSDGVGRPFDTYELDKRQSMAVSAKLNTAMLMRVIDRWHELESLNQQTELEMLLLTVQKAVEHERNIKEIQHQQHETTAQLTALMEGENYFTVVGYANLIGKRIDSKTASSIGKKTTKLCKAEGWRTGTANHPVFGCCNTYPREALELIFMDEVA